VAKCGHLRSLVPQVTAASVHEERSVSKRTTPRCASSTIYASGKEKGCLLRGDSRVLDEARRGGAQQAAAVCSREQL
jgi:hypothetical protein